jgi:hypothetical protein
VSFLDDLKRQADALRQQQSQDKAEFQRHFEATEAACRAALAYFNTLADQLEVLRPASRARYTLDRQHSYADLPMTDFFADARRRPVGSEEGFDHLLLHWQLKTGQTLHLVKDFPPDIERLEARLHQAAVPMERDVVRNPDNGKLVEVRYRVSLDFRASVRLTPRHEEARVHFQLQNVEALEGLSFDLAADQVDAPRLDELAKCITGHPHRLLDGAQNLRRTVC